MYEGCPISYAKFGENSGGASPPCRAKVNDAICSYSDNEWICFQAHEIIFHAFHSPRPAGPRDFPPPDEGGGLESPPLTRLPGHVAIRGRRHSKERQI